jgi:hypothetical protein
MKYMLLIYSDHNQPQSEAELQAEMQAYYAFEEEVRPSGVYVGGEGLHPMTAATTVRVRDGKTLTTDGPFAETHEHLGGFYLLDCKDLDEAISWAAKIPTSTSGSIEIRPVMDFSQAQ